MGRQWWRPLVARLELELEPRLGFAWMHCSMIAVLSSYPMDIIYIYIISIYNPYIYYIRSITYYVIDLFRYKKHLETTKNIRRVNENIS